MENKTKEVTVQDYIDYIKGNKSFNEVIQHARKSENAFAVISD